MQHELDKKLLDAINSNSDESYEYLYDRYSCLLRSFAYSFLNDWTMAEDIVQESFIGLWAQKQELKTLNDVRNLLFAITRNKAIDYVRKRIRNIPIDDYTEEDYFLYRKSIVLENSDFSSIELEDLKSHLDRIFVSLPDKYKEVFTLSRIDCMTNKEIAQSLNISIKTVEKRITATLKIYRDSLNDYHFLAYFFLGII